MIYSNVELRAKADHDIDMARRNPIEYGEIVMESNDDWCVIEPNRKILGMFQSHLDLDPRAYNSDVLKTGENTVEIDRRAPRDTVADGTDPFIQIICRSIDRVDGMTFSEIYSNIAKERRLVKDNEENRRKVKRLLHTAWDRNYLVKKVGQGSKDKYVLGSKGPTIGHNKMWINIQDGYNPILKQICDFISSNDSATEGELRSHMVDMLRWFDTADNPNEAFQSTIRYMDDNDIIKKVGNEYMIEQGLTPYTPE